MTVGQNDVGIYSVEKDTTVRVLAAAEHMGVPCRRLAEHELLDGELSELPSIVLLCAPSQLTADFSLRLKQAEAGTGHVPLRLISCSPQPGAPDDSARLFISALRGITPAQVSAGDHTLPPLPPIDWSEEEEALFFSHDPEVLRTIITAQRISRVAVDIVIEGETGVGKDTLARKIHAISGRTGRYIAVNSASKPAHLPVP